MPANRIASWPVGEVWLVHDGYGGRLFQLLATEEQAQFVADFHGPHNPRIGVERHHVDAVGPDFPKAVDDGTSTEPESPESAAERAERFVGAFIDAWPAAAMYQPWLVEMVAKAITPGALEVLTVDQFNQQVSAERERQKAKGYTAEHDREHGIDHLLMWAIDYAWRGDRVKFAALIEAARELLKPTPPAPTDRGHGIRWCRSCETAQPLDVMGYMAEHRKADGSRCGGSHWIGAPLPEPTDPAAVHSCESCETCGCGGRKCCGCYDGACCQDIAPEPTASKAGR